MRVYACAQRSAEWYQLRAGRLTGSSAAAILAKGKGSAEAVARRDLRCRLIAERLTGQAQEGGFVSEAMQRGIDKEAAAIAAYETQAGAMVLPVGFIAHAELQAGCSPDGLIGHDGLLEVKCPKTATHLGYFDAPYTLVEEYRAQIIHNLWVTQRSWCHVVSFDDRLPPHLQLVIGTYGGKANVAEIASYELAARQFLTAVDEAVAKYAPTVAEVA